MNDSATTSRREFLKGAAGALVIGFTLPVAGRLAQAANGGGTFAPNAFLRITADGMVTVVCGQSEMGQGVLNGIATLVAEELDADWRNVRIEQAPADPAYANPLLGVQVTGGSMSIRGLWQPMRKAGAAARSMLVSAAAQAWGASEADCRTENGRVLHRDGRSLGYGDLAGRASALPVPKDPPLKNPQNFRLVGKRKGRIDAPAKVDGSAVFGLDVRLPGLLTAVMAHAPTPGAKVVALDDTAAKSIPGVRQVLQIPQGVAVLADGFWPALKGRDALQLQWDAGALGSLSSQQVSRMLIDAAAQSGKVARNDGDVDVAAPRTLEAVYEAPYLAHACMEPMNCTADVRTDRAEIWAPTQAPGVNHGMVAQLTGLPQQQVRIHTTFLGGGFGRRVAPDFVTAATLLSKAAKAPVKLVYTREDDTRAWFYRPATVVRFKAGLDAGGQLLALTARSAAPSVMLPSGFVKELEGGIDGPAVEGINDMPYAVPNFRVEYARVEAGIPVWFWRSVGHSQNVFFLESFIDELAHATGTDPLQFRRALLAKNPRMLSALDLAAAKAGWGQPTAPRVHRGVAVTASFGSYVAEIAEVSVGKDGNVRVHRVVAAVDCGQTVNPDTVRRQVEGAIAYGLSAALYGRITIKDGRVEQSNFTDYPMLRMDEMPQVEVHIVPSAESPGGIGEPGLPPAAPAVVNAIFAATGKRLRTLPIDAGALRQA